MDTVTDEEFEKRCKKPDAVFLCKICKKFFQGTATFLNHKKSGHKKEKEIEVIVIDDDEEEDAAPISDASNSLHRYRPGPKSKKNLLRIPDGEENQESHVAVNQKTADLAKKSYCRPGPKSKKKPPVFSQEDTDGNKRETVLNSIQGPVDADSEVESNASNKEVAPTPNDGNEAEQKDMEEQNVGSSGGALEKVKKCIQERVDADVEVVKNANNEEVALTFNEGDEAKQKDVEEQNLISSVSAVEKVKKQAKYRPGPKCKKKIFMMSTEERRINDGIGQSAHSDSTDKNDTNPETAMQDPSTRTEKGEKEQRHLDSVRELKQDSSKCVVDEAGDSVTKIKYRPGPKSKKKLIPVPRILENSHDESGHASPVTQNSSVEAQIIFVTDSSEDLMEVSIEGNENSLTQIENEEVHVDIDEMTVELPCDSPDLMSTNKLVNILSDRHEVSDFSEQETDWQITSDTIAQVQTTVVQNLAVLGAKNPSESNVIQDSTISSGEWHRNQSKYLNLATVNPKISTDTNPNVAVSELVSDCDGVISTKARTSNPHLRNTKTILSGNNGVSFSENLPFSGSKVLGLAQVGSVHYQTTSEALSNPSAMGLQAAEKNKDNENLNLNSQDQSATAETVEIHKNVLQSNPGPSLDEEDELSLVRKELLLLLEGTPSESCQAEKSAVTDSSTLSEHVVQNKLSTSSNNSSLSVHTSLSPETAVTSDSGLSTASSEKSFTSSVLSSSSGLTVPTGVENSTQASSTGEVPKSVPVIKRGRGRPRKTINISSGIVNGTPRAVSGHIRNVSNKRKGTKRRKPGRPKKTGANTCKKAGKNPALKSGRGPGRPRKSDSPVKPNPPLARVPPEDKTNISEICSETEQTQSGNPNFASSAVNTASTTESSGNESSNHPLEPVRSLTDLQEQPKECRKSDSKSDSNRVPASLISSALANQNRQLASSQISEKSDKSRILPKSYSITNLGKIPRKQVPDSVSEGQQYHKRKTDSTEGTVTARFGEVVGVASGGESSQLPRSAEAVTSRVAPKSAILYDYRKPAPVRQNSMEISTCKFTSPPPRCDISDCLSAANTVPSLVRAPPSEKTQNRIPRPSEPAKKTRITLEEYKKERYLNPQSDNVPPLKGILKKPAIAAENQRGPAIRISDTALDTNQSKASSQVEEIAIPSIRSPDKTCVKLTRTSSQETCRIIPGEVYQEPKEIPAKKDAKLSSAGDDVSRVPGRSGPFMPYVNPSPPASPPPSEHGLFARREQSAPPIKELDCLSSNGFSSSEPLRITPIRQQPRIIPLNVSVPTPSPSNNSISSVASNGSSSNEAVVSPPDIPSFRDMYFRPRKRRMSAISAKGLSRDDVLSIASDSSSDLSITPRSSILERPTSTCIIDYNAVNREASDDKSSQVTAGLLKLPTTNLNQKNAKNEVLPFGSSKSATVKPHISPRSEMGKAIADGIHALEATKDVGADLDGLEGLLDLDDLQSEIPTAEAVAALSDPRIRKRKEPQLTSGLTPGRPPEEPASSRSPSPGAESTVSSSWSASGSQRPSERSSLSAGRRESKESVNTQSSFSSSDSRNRPNQYKKSSYSREHRRSRSSRRDSSESNGYRHKSRNRSRDRSHQKRSRSRSRHQRGRSPYRSYHSRSRSRGRADHRRRDSRGRSGTRRSRSREDHRGDRSPSRSRCEKIRHRSHSYRRSRSR